MGNKISEYASTGDSVSLAKIDGKSFTIISVEDSPYRDGDKITQGIKITTKEMFDIEGEEHNRFHTTRGVLVGKLSPVDIDGHIANQKLTESLASGNEIGPVKCEKAEGKKYFNLIDAN